MATSHPIPDCCLRAIQWDDTPVGREDTTLSSLPSPAYIVGSNPNVAILLIHDLFGWTFPNLRLLADRYAAEADATVYLPDFFGGEVLPFEPISKARWHEIDLAGFMGRNARAVREPEMFAFARALRTRHARVGAVGFCYGGWAVHRLGAREHGVDAEGRGLLVDCASAGHPSLLTKNDVDELAAPMQILAPEVDGQFTDEMKLHSFLTMQRNGVPFDYQHFPGVEHAAFVRGDPGVKGEREAMERAKNATVAWMRQWLHDLK